MFPINLLGKVQYYWKNPVSRLNLKVFMYANRHVVKSTGEFNAKTMRIFELNWALSLVFINTVKRKRSSKFEKRCAVLPVGVFCHKC